MFDILAHIFFLIMQIIVVINYLGLVSRFRRKIILKAEVIHPSIAIHTDLAYLMLSFVMKYCQICV